VEDDSISHHRVFEAVLDSMSPLILKGRKPCEKMNRIQICIIVAVN